MSPLNAAICTTISYTLWVEWYYFKKQLFDLEVKGQCHTKVITVRDTPLMVMHPHAKWPISKDKCYGPDKKILFKNNYLSLRSKIKFTWRSLRYATHHLMVMHPHTKYNWRIIWKDKKVMVRTSFAEKKQKRKKKNQTKIICLPSFEGET